MKSDGLQVMRDGCRELGIDLPELVAACSLWASPDVFSKLWEENGQGVWYPGERRARDADGEVKGTIKDGIRLDDNTYANHALKQALPAGHGGFRNWAVCHVWPNTCYDEHYRTCIANLVLLPSPLASLTGFDPQVQAALQFRSWDLYGWRPDGAAEPVRGEGYPAKWRDHEQEPEDIRRRILNRHYQPAAASVEASALIAIGPRHHSC